MPKATPAAEQLTPCQRELLERLTPLLERLDPNKVTPQSGVRVREVERRPLVEVVLEPPGERVPGLWLSAGPDQLVLGIAGGEALECHHDPGPGSELIDTVVGLTARFLSGVTVLEHCNRRGHAVRTEYFFGTDSEAAPASRIGTSRRFVFPWTITGTVKRTFRFLKEEGAA
jgi:hypothetical protein